MTGKCPPTRDELARAADNGFDAVELYLEPTHLDTVDEVLDATKNAAVDVASVHTPHVNYGDHEYFALADWVADVNDAFLVVHSTHVDFETAPCIQNHIDFAAPYGFENDRGTTLESIRAFLSTGGRVVLDTAHLYAAEPDYVEALADLLADYADHIPVIHFTDATDTRDNLPLGEGDMDLARVRGVITERHEGVVVLEVMPEHQPAAKTWFENAPSRPTSRTSLE